MTFRMLAPALVCSSAFLLLAVAPSPSPILTDWSNYFSGTWHCLSGKTPYTVSYRAALGGYWVRGINVSRASQSEDMLTYSARTKQWTLFDMEPTGVWFAMHGPSDAVGIHLFDSVSRLHILVHRIDADGYALKFLTPGAAKGTSDTCRRSATR